jgi:hypothetical protein
VFWRVLARSGLFYDMLRVLACSVVFWYVLGMFWCVLVCSGSVLRSGLFYDMLSVLACSGVLWRVLGCSRAFRAVL